MFQKFKAGALIIFLLRMLISRKLKENTTFLKGGGAVPDKTIRKTLKFDLVQEGGGAASVELYGITLSP